jgi:hypothetical protein
MSLFAGGPVLDGPLGEPVMYGEFGFAPAALLAVLPAAMVIANKLISSLAKSGAAPVDPRTVATNLLTTAAQTATQAATNLLPTGVQQFVQPATTLLPTAAQQFVQPTPVQEIIAPAAEAQAMDVAPSVDAAAAEEAPGAAAETTSTDETNGFGDPATAANVGLGVALAVSALAGGLGLYCALRKPKRR